MTVKIPAAFVMQNMQRKFLLQVIRDVGIIRENLAVGHMAAAVQGIMVLSCLTQDSCVQLLASGWPNVTPSEPC